MKRVIILLTMILLVNQSCQNDKTLNQPSNILEKFNTVQKQIFKLDTLNQLEINGKKGTIIYYKRNVFNVSDSIPVTLELKEFYNLDDLIYNNINTITNKNQLLESSGVIQIRFFGNKKELELKKDSFLLIKTPRKNSIDTKLFTAKLDSLNQFEWIELDERKAIIKEYNITELVRGVNTNIQVTDTVGYSNGAYRKLDSISDEFLINRMSWLNFDRIIKEVPLFDFDIELKNQGVNFVNSYILYENYISFVSFYHKKNELNFSNIPIIKDSTSIILIGMERDSFVAERIKLNRKSNKYELELKHISESELKKLLK